MQVDISEITALTRDRNTSIRLYRSYRKDYPDRTPQWVVQKVCQDLERDRRTAPTHRTIRTRPGKGSPLWWNQRGSYPQWQTIKPGWALATLLGLSVVGGWLMDNVGYVGSVHDRNYLNFPPPDPFKTVEQGTFVEMHNRTNEVMSIRLEGTQNYSFRIEPCLNCPNMVTPEMADNWCNSPGPSLMMAVSPGTYDVKVDFSGDTRGLKSQWTLTPQMSYYQCLLTRNPAS